MTQIGNPGLTGNTLNKDRSYLPNDQTGMLRRTVPLIDITTKQPVQEEETTNKEIEQNISDAIQGIDKKKQNKH